MSLLLLFQGLDDDQRPGAVGRSSVLSYRISRGLLVKRQQTKYPIPTAPLFNNSGVVASSSTNILVGLTASAVGESSQLRYRIARGLLLVRQRVKYPIVVSASAVTVFASGIAGAFGRTALAGSAAVRAVSGAVTAVRTSLVVSAAIGAVSNSISATRSTLIGSVGILARGGSVAQSFNSLALKTGLSATSSAASAGRALLSTGAVLVVSATTAARSTAFLVGNTSLTATSNAVSAAGVALTTISSNVTIAANAVASAISSVIISVTSPPAPPSSPSGPANTGGINAGVLGLLLPGLRYWAGQEPDEPRKKPQPITAPPDTGFITVPVVRYAILEPTAVVQTIKPEDPNYLTEEERLLILALMDE